MENTTKKGIILFLLSGLWTVILPTATFAQDASDFKIDEKGTITLFDGFDTVIVIPAKIGNVTVTAIGNKVFQNSNITSVTFPPGIKKIGEEAFSKNKLTTVAIPDGVTIGYYAFRDNQLTSITIGNNVSIGYDAFAKNKLISVTAGNNVAFSGNAFRDNKIAGFTMGNGGSIARSAFNSHINDSTPANLVLGANIDFGQNAFNRSVYIDYMCNNRKAGIYNGAANYAEKTEGDYQFMETAYGVAITRYKGTDGRLQIPRQLGGVDVKGIFSGFMTSAAFASKEIVRIQLPEGLVFIGDRTFERNRLTSVTIPKSVTSIGDWAFEFNELTSITIGANVTTSSSSSFENYYNEQKQKAGTYTRNGDDTWTRK